jgi:hypothetical protein
MPFSNYHYMMKEILNKATNYYGHFINNVFLYSIINEKKFDIKR